MVKRGHLCTVGDNMDVIAGLGLMFGGNSDTNDSSNADEQEVKQLIVKSPKSVIYYDTAEQVSEVSSYNVPHVVREVYEDISDQYYQLLISGIDTDEEKIIGIKDLKTEKVVNIVSEV